MLTVTMFVVDYGHAQVGSVSLDLMAKSPSPGDFPLVAQGKAAALYVDGEAFPGVRRVATHLHYDIGNVSGHRPVIVSDISGPDGAVVIIATMGRSVILDKLITQGSVNEEDLLDKRETYLIKTVERLFGDDTHALVIAGSDKRGTIYGMYDLAEAIGVSPWNWWADVPVVRREEVYIRNGQYSAGEPKVKYRGIFINDEAPALTGWVHEHYGSFNHQFYDRVFQLILRLKGNYLWPAMWRPRAFYVDDPQNAVLADEYGVVIGTTHHEPLMRAHDEWDKYGKGPWNYATNSERLREFWQGGMERMGDNESIVSIGMRGDGDKPMSEESNIALLEGIVADQRKIIADVTGKPASETPQLWALYKEVQEYYDRGMRVPDDVILLFCDDNWGNIRKLPKPGEPRHPGGYGIYYHFDYVGGPRNYKWLNTNQIPRIWEQMHLAYQHGADQIWIVNVGDIKPMELPIQFFLDYAWDPDGWPLERLPDYTTIWARQQFGSEHAEEIAELLDLYTQYNSRRKPELLNEPTFSLQHFDEHQRVVDDYLKLEARADSLYQVLPDRYHDAYYQLVMHPIEACANLNAMYLAQAKNHWYAEQGRGSTNAYADSVRKRFKRDAAITHHYNSILAGGKWNHMMDQTHISYTYWQQPEKDVVPEVHEIDVPMTADMGVAIAGSEDWWPESGQEAWLPEYDVFAQQQYAIEIFNRGKTAFTFSAAADMGWIALSQTSGRIEDQAVLLVRVLWDKLPIGRYKGRVSISGPRNQSVDVVVSAFKPEGHQSAEGFTASGGYVSIEAANYNSAIAEPPYRWNEIPGLGKTHSGITLFPVEAGPGEPTSDSPHLEYDVYLLEGGEVRVEAFLSPTLDIYNSGGLRYALSIDDGEPMVVNMHADRTHRAWQRWVSHNINRVVTSLPVSGPGQHTLKFWPVDPGVVLQKIVIHADSWPRSNLGPPESPYISSKNR